ncbi:hypothetical protein DPMN_160365 [Dreissena polymorpha]|uniref:Uncharacterized protein n=1 Tax=Dreissena polymorpha TaxID=45954 RepID=A0A9D4IQ22_DREPO|nr:hypothetical protein DPMN_160365 [Dreissena polymorpha]
MAPDTKWPDGRMDGRTAGRTDGQRQNNIPPPLAGDKNKDHLDWEKNLRLVMGPCIVEIDRVVIRDVQYQFEVNRCRNEEVHFQGSSANSVGGDSGQDGQTDGRDNHIIL